MAASPWHHSSENSDAASESELIELERARIGHELHDTLLPLVFAASASVHRMVDDQRGSATDAQPPSLASERLKETERLEQVARWLQDALQMGRKLLVEVYPPELQGRDWRAAVEDTLSRLHDTQFELSWQVDPEINAQPEAIRIAAYRIAVEAARNALRHGRASAIEISTRRQDSRWTLEVVDQGSGFEPAKIAADRFGVRSMFGRAKLVGGNCSIDSQAGGPTRVTFSWPDHPQHANVPLPSRP